MSSLLAQYGTYEEELMGHAESIVARAGGGQTFATQLTKKWNQVDTVASNSDSVVLLHGEKGFKQVVFNNGTKRLAIYVAPGDLLYGVTNGFYEILPGATIVFECPMEGNWICSYAPSIIMQKKVSLTRSQILNLHSTPITLVSAIGSGYAIELISGSWRYNAGTSYYTGGSGIGIYTKTGTVLHTQPIGIGFSSTTSGFVSLVCGGGTIIDNKDLVVTNSTDFTDSGSSAGTFDIYITYRFITL